MTKIDAVIVHLRFGNVVITPFALLLSGLGMAAFTLAVLRLPSLEFTPLAWTGKVSYSIYLLHFPIIVYGHHKFGHLRVAQLIGIGLLIAICAALMHRWVELPGMALARRITRPKPA